jgi:hypothetical protein
MMSVTAEHEPLLAEPAGATSPATGSRARPNSTSGGPAGLALWGQATDVRGAADSAPRTRVR